MADEILYDSVVKVTWDPDGAALVLVDYGDPMWEPVKIDGKQAVQESPGLRRAGVKNYPRGNEKHDLRFTLARITAGIAAATEARIVAMPGHPRTMRDVMISFQSGTQRRLKNCAIESWPNEQVEHLTKETLVIRGGELVEAAAVEDAAEGVNAAGLYISAGSSGMFLSGGAEAGERGLIASIENLGTGVDPVQATSGERPRAMVGDGWYFPGTAGNLVEWSHAASLVPGNNFSARWDGVLPSYRPASRVTLLSKWSEPSLCSWAFHLEPTGHLTLAVTTNGTTGTLTEWTSSVPVNIRSGAPVGLQFIKNQTLLSFYLYDGADDQTASSLIGAQLTISDLTAANVVSPITLGASGFSSHVLEGRTHRVNYWTSPVWFNPSTIFRRDFREGREESITPVTGGIGRSGTNPLLGNDRVIRCDGSDDSLVMAEPVKLNAVTSATVVWKGYINRVTGTQDLIYCGTAGTDPRILLRLVGTGVELHVRRDDSEATAVISYAAGLTYGNYVRLAALVDFALGEAYIFREYSPVVSGALTSAGATSPTDSSETRISAGQGGANPAAVDVDVAFIAETPYDMLQMEELLGQL